MQLTSEQIAMISIKEASLDDSLKRNPLVDYFEGYFHVTLNTRGESPTLGYIVGNPDAADGSTDAPRCLLTHVGKGVKKCWENIPNFYPNVTIIESQVMPEHFHGLLHLEFKKGVNLGRVINGFMIGCSHEYWDVIGIDWRSNRGATKEEWRAIARKFQDKHHTRSFRGPALFVRSYNEVEAVTEEEVEIKRQYIRNNPRKRLITRSKPDRFLISRDHHSANWTLSRALNAVAADKWIGRDPAKCQKLQANIQARLKEGMSIDIIGNMQLLGSARKVSLICHRADSNLFEQQKAAVLKAAREGAVVVSAFISPRERDIMKQLMVEQLPFMEIMDNGFSERYKPTGKAFYSTAENRHVQLTCWKYIYQRETQISREMCLVMNELARLISGISDDWWKYLRE